MFPLKDVLAALVVIRIMVQFLLQVTGLLLLRARQPDYPRPFRMYLYPVPAILAGLGFIYILFTRPSWKEVRFGAAIAFIGVIIFVIRSWRRKEWPFSGASAHNTAQEAVQ